STSIEIFEQCAEAGIELREQRPFEDVEGGRLIRDRTMSVPGGIAVRRPSDQHHPRSGLDETAGQKAALAITVPPVAIAQPNMLARKVECSARQVGRQECKRAPLVFTHRAHDVVALERIESVVDLV